MVTEDGNIILMSSAICIDVCFVSVSARPASRAAPLLCRRENVDGNIILMSSAICIDVCFVSVSARPASRAAPLLCGREGVDGSSKTMPCCFAFKPDNETRYVDLNYVGFGHVAYSAKIDVLTLYAD